MRLDAAGPRTWLLAALAGGGAVAWVLALAGMGGRIEPLPDDPSLQRPLPRDVAPAPARLGPLAQYDEIGSRPLFTSDRRPKPFSLQSGEPGAEAQTFDYVLTGVIQAPSLQIAVLQPAGGGEPVRLRVGESPEGAGAWRLVAVHPRSAVFEGPEGQQAIDLRTWDGVGGAPPTPSQPPAPPASADVMTDADAPAPPDAAMPTAAPQTVESAEADQAPTADDAQARMDAIRRRIEARREQLRREAQSGGNAKPTGEAGREDPPMSPPTR
ncbi:general secretion pathway protein XpsN [Luteimonas pelagia]